MYNKIKIKIMRSLSLFSLSRSFLIFIKKQTNAIFFKSIKPKANLSFIPNIDKVVEEVKLDGFSNDLIVPKNILNEIVKYSRTSNYTEQYTNISYKIDYDKPVKPGSNLWYGNKKIFRDCEAVKHLVYDKNILKICEKYLGKNFKIIDCHSWWSFSPSEESNNHQYGFHYDIDSPKFLKFFLYLTDVDIDTGPHVIVKGTHRNKSYTEKVNRRVHEEYLSKKYGNDKIIIKTGPRGSLFFEDTFAYHKGTTPKKPRLILQAEYSV